MIFLGLLLIFLELFFKTLRKAGNKLNNCFPPENLKKAVKSRIKNSKNEKSQMFEQ
jgi:hypothetical protein